MEAQGKMRICVIFNPAARGDKARGFRERLAILAKEAMLRPTTGAGTGRAIAAEAAGEGFDVIVAAGGDGTVNEVLNGIADAPHGLDQVRFAVLPLGTINVFAREIRMPKAISAAWEVILAGHETRIDLPEAQFSTEAGPQSRYFAQMAGAGWDSLAIDAVSWQTKKRIGGMAYVTAGLRVLAGRMPEVIASDGASTIRGKLILVGNGQFYGGNYRFFPLADLRDGLLDVTVFKGVRPDRIARALAGLALNKLYTIGGATHFKARELTLESASRMPFHVEGETAGWLPARFCIRGKALRVVVP
jgi:YegS/Rv2252/BmrU family lipid kinase